MMSPVEPCTPVPVLFVHYGEDWIRGSERCLLDLLAHLNRSRFQPVAWCNAPSMAEAVRNLGVPVVHDPFSMMLDKVPPRFRAAAYWRVVCGACALVRRNRIRLIHANSGSPNQWLVPVAREARVPLLTHLHAPYLPRSRYLLGIHQATLAVGVSRAVVASLAADGMAPERIKVIYNGVDAARIGEGNARQLRRSLGIGEGALVALCAASLIRRKGLDIAIRALALLASDAVHLLVAGGGEERDSLEALAREMGVRDRVHFLGERPHVGAIFRDAADIAVLASRTEAFPLVLLEAAAMGIPAVATSVWGVPEFVEDGFTGLLVEPERPDQLARAIARLAANPETRREMGIRARRRVEAGFTVERMARAFEAEYERLLAEPADCLGWGAAWNSAGPYRRMLFDFGERHGG